MKNLITTVCFFIIFIFSIASLKAEVVFVKQLSLVENTDLAIGNFIEWKTSLETGVHYFYVQKSDDGINFENAGNPIAAKGSNDINSYHFLDLMASKGTTYYRLLIMDNKSGASFTNVTKVDRQNINDVQILSMSSLNIENHFSMEFNLNTATSVDLVVLNAQNNAVYQKSIAGKKGSNHYEINFDSLPKGSYSIELRKGNEKEQVLVKKTK